MSARKGYSDGPEGQLHWRMMAPESEPQGADLYCFSPAPFGSIAFTSIMPHLAQNRRVIAPDYPGQAGSDGTVISPTIESYAASMRAVIDDLSGDRSIDVLGFHSGCLVAAELKREMPKRIDHAVLIDVPAFDPETRAKFLSMVGQPFEVSACLESLSKAWDMAVTKRLETQSLAHSLAMFADTVGNGPRMNATFHAAFTYDIEASFKALQEQVTIMASQSALLDPSRRAADLISESVLIEMLDVKRSVLDGNAEVTAKRVLSVIE